MDRVKQQKAEQRKSVLSELKNLSASQKTQESSILRERLAEYISNNCPKGSVIASFAGLSFEPDLLGLHQLLPDYQFAYPRCGPDRSMLFHKVADTETELVKGYYGIREPEDNSHSLVPTDQIALFIVPAFAYTKEGLRLGKGGGYYDRVLSSVSDSVPLIGVSFSVQLKNELPVEGHDIAVHQVIYPM